MGVISKKLSTVDGYLSAIYRNPKNGWYEIEIGLPINWVIKETKEINCEVTQSNDKGKFVLVSPKPNFNIDIDDLITFICYVVETNKKVEEKEKELRSILEAEKSALEAKVNVYLSDLESLKEDSFKTYVTPEISSEEDSDSVEEPKIPKINTKGVKKSTLLKKNSENAEEESE